MSSLLTAPEQIFLRASYKVGEDDAVSEEHPNELHDLHQVVTPDNRHC